MPAPRHLLYLHGFASSPASAKAQRMARLVAEMQDAGHAIEWCCPQLPPAPDEAMALIERRTAAWPAHEMAVIGSSLGGFYATVLAERRVDCRAVLLNPAVDPALSLASQIGEQHSWHDPALRFEFTAQHVGQLRSLQPVTMTRPERYFAVIAKGDELLDWRPMHARYAGARIKLLEAGDHALCDFEDHLPDIAAFLELTSGG